MEAALERALRRRTELIRERTGARLLKEELVSLGAELARERTKVQDLSVATLESLVRVVEARDSWFAGPRTASRAALCLSGSGAGAHRRGGREGQARRPAP